MTRDIDGPMTRSPCREKTSICQNCDEIQMEYLGVMYVK